MIDKKLVQSLANQALKESDYFIVEITISNSNSINVIIDSPNGASIEFCVLVSRAIEHSLDREIEDFELEVSSPGIGQPLKVLGQYLKLIGKTVEVLTAEGQKLTGKLVDATEEQISIEVEETKKIEGQKKKQKVVTAYTFAYSELKSTIEKLKF
jgi:ribosome maturation factor RimP